MDYLDMILFICFMVAAVVGALLIFHLCGLAYLKFREWRFIKKRFGGVEPFWWRIK